MERSGRRAKACRIKGSLMVATLPVAARRRCFLPSWMWLAARKGVEDDESLAAAVVELMVDKVASSQRATSSTCRQVTAGVLLVLLRNRRWQ